MKTIRRLLTIGAVLLPLLLHAASASYVGPTAEANVGAVGPNAWQTGTQTLGSVGGLTADSATADYVPAHALIYCGDGGSWTHFKIKIYDSTGASVASWTSSVGNPSSNSWVSVDFSGATALTPGSKYYIGVVVDANYGRVMAGSTSWKLDYSSSGSYASPVSSIGVGTDEEYSFAEFGLYVTNAANQLLIGQQTCSGYTSSQILVANMMEYFEDGYTCVTLP